MRVLGWPAYKFRQINPYPWLLYSHLSKYGVSTDEFSTARLLFGGYDILHVHWPEHHFIRPGAFETLLRVASVLAILSIARIRGTRLVWTVHNMQPHKRYHPMIERWFWKLFPRLIDAYFSLNFSALDHIKTDYPALCRKKGFVALHGHYRGFYRDDISKEDARKKLDIDVSATVIGFLGRISVYKNTVSLIKNFFKLKDENLVLLLAGAPDGESIEEIKELARNDSRIRLYLGLIQEDDIQLYLKAADLAVLPFLEILNSGTAMLSLSFNCPILVPEKGSMGELKGYVGDEWVRTYSGDLTSEKIQDALDWCKGARTADCPDLERFDWNKVAEQTKNGFERCLE